jgi:hypothetical protein
MAIAIVSHPGDGHAQAVAAALVARGAPAAIIDTSAFPMNMRLSIEVDNERHNTSLRNGHTAFHVDDLNVVWWRRPQAYGLDPALDPSVAGFAYSECHEAISGMWHGLDATWVNDPSLDEVAHHKPLQLKVAHELGLRIPRTLITNDPDAARRFVAAQGPDQTIFKTFIALEECWRETRVVTAEELGKLDAVRLAPLIFQEFVEAKADLRVTMFGPKALAAEIVTPKDGYRYDYRVDLEVVAMRPTTLPSKVERALLDLMRRLGLIYGAIDLRLTPEGDYVFLEVNPAGEFLFVEERCELPLTATMADLLCKLDREHGNGRGRSN